MRLQMRGHQAEWTEELRYTPQAPAFHLEPVQSAIGLRLLTCE